MADITLPALSPSAEFRAEAGGIRVSLCAVEPGSEPEQIRALLQAYPAALVCKVFGIPDIAVIEPWNEGDDLRPTLVAFPHLREVHNLVCFGRGHGNITIDDIRSFPLICLVFLKLDESSLYRAGLATEDIYLHRLRASIEHADPAWARPARVMVLSSLGWYEVVMVIGCDTFGPVMKTLLEVPGYNLPDTMGSTVLSSRGDFPLTSTLTYPCIRIDRRGKGVIPAYAARDGETFRVRLSCKRGYEYMALDVFKRTFGKYFDNVYSVFGPYDFLIQLHKLPSIRAFVEKLWKFRAEAASLINWTSSLIAKELQDIPLMPQYQGITQRLDLPSLPLVPMPTDDAAESLKQQHPSAYSRLAQAIESYNMVAADAKLESVCTPLQPFLEDMCRRLKEFIPQPIHGPGVSEASGLARRHPQRLIERLDLFQYALAQRRTGTPLYFPRPGIGIPGWSAGAHRSLSAAEHVVRYLLDRVGRAGEQWHGFVITGFGGEFHRYPGGVIDMPVQVLDKPDEWWGLFHEAGHELGIQIDITSKVTGVLETITGYRGELHREMVAISFDMDTAAIDTLAVEVFADIFGLECGFGINNWEHYLSRVWSYFDREQIFVTKPEELLIRWVLTYCYYLYVKHDYIIKNRKDMRTVAETFIGEVMKYCGPVERHIQEYGLAFHCRVAWDIYDIILEFRDIFAECEQVYDSEDESYRRYIKQGRIAPQVKNPAGLIVNALKDEACSVKERMAIIWSLWNASIQAGTTVQT